MEKPLIVHCDRKKMLRLYYFYSSVSGKYNFGREE